MAKTCRTPKQVLLYVSSDEGKTYRYIDRLKGSGAFSFTAPTDGHYAFHVETAAEGEPVADSLAGKKPALAVCIDTAAPRVELSAQAKEGKLAVAWKIEEEHLDAQSLKLSYRVRGSDEWTPVTPLSQRKTGFEHFKPDGKVTAVRMRAADMAGNSKEATVQLDPDTGLPIR